MNKLYKSFKVAFFNVLWLLGSGAVLFIPFKAYTQPFPKSPEPWQDEYNISMDDFEIQHPMTVLNATDLNTVLERINNNIEPQFSAFHALIAEADLQLAFTPDAPDVMDIMGGYDTNSNLSEMREWLWRNSHAAYTCALAYALTKESQYGQTAYNVIMDWANTYTTFTGGDRGLQLGSWFSPMLSAADLIWDFPGFSSFDKEQLKGWVRNKWLDEGDVLDVMRRKDNNWKDAGIKGVMCAAVVLEDKELLQEAIIQLKSYFYTRTDEYVENPGPGWKIKKDSCGVYLPREVVRNEGRSGITYTAYALTTIVQNLEIARYAGFNFWFNTTEQGATIKDLILQYYRWNTAGERFPWDSNANITSKRLNSYELANTCFEIENDTKTWIENHRPINGREGDEWITLTKGDMALESHARIVSPMNGEGFLLSDTLAVTVYSMIAIDTLQVYIDDTVKVVEFDIPFKEVKTFVPLSGSSVGEHIVCVRIVDESTNVSLDSIGIRTGSVFYTITDLTDSKFGNANLDPPGGLYVETTRVKVTAAPNPGYVFMNWAGDINLWTDTITVTMDSNITLKSNYYWFFEKLRTYTLQAEDNLYSDGVEIKDDQAGFNGSGFVSFPDNSFVTFTNLKGGNGGSAKLSLRWANGDSNRTGFLVVNSDTLSLTMESTGGWDIWTSKDIPIVLNPDSLNIISFQSTDQGFGNLDEITVTLSTLTDIKETIQKPINSFALAQNYPNPFNPVTQIYFNLPLNIHTTLTVYNSLGQVVKVLVNKKMESGYHCITFNAGDLPSGLYWYRLQCGQFSDSKKMTLIK